MIGRLAREQINGVETYEATWLHPDGSTWKTVGTVVIPGAVNRGVSVWTKVGIRKVGFDEASVIWRVLPITVGDDTGVVSGRIIGIGAGPATGDTLVYESDLAASDVQFVMTVGVVNVSIEVQVQCPTFAAAESINVTAELWWE